MFDLEVGFNLVEGIVWLVIAAIVFWRSRREGTKMRRLGGFTSIGFILFGISDFIEMRTGAWWDPSWLLILKASCILGFAVAGWKYCQLRRQNDQGKV